MFVDLTLSITEAMITRAQRNEQKAFAGHLGTHFDVMDKEFPLAYIERNAVVFDVTGAEDRDIEVGDVDLSAVQAGMFVAFFTGFIESEGYGGERYFREHPQLSHRLIDELLERRIAIIGVDFAGIRRGAEHTPKDQYCAERGVFVVENLCGLRGILGEKQHEFFTAITCPLIYEGATGLPCRVVAKVADRRASAPHPSPSKSA